MIPYLKLTVINKFSLEKLGDLVKENSGVIDYQI